MTGAFLEAARNIGFSAAIRRGTKVLHVQTEVLGQDPLTVQTTVVENGAVRFSRSEQWPAELEDLTQAASYVEARHRDVVEQLNRGAFG